jgi:ureidoglycolate dehydrogenase (NAD+)
MIDVLCSMLTGSPFGPEIPKMYGDMTRQRQLGGLVGAIRIAPFVDPEQFAQRVALLIGALGGLKTAPGVDRVRFPGEPELETQAVRLREGIPLGLRTFTELNQYTREAGLAALSSRD